ncbi:EF-hand [Trametes versicolor FP-101664 SS1]|uniref:EF-hand n=1 Tax=Trametes versicolor (strain FP-101664) TaxID=717944 RepID=UPI00046213FF|nr:EF-hand [Trametes versicolor FP-101664 SS1]EIW60634.1 EF-hand [Trametes versicolor FP-101664 SS1]
MHEDLERIAIEQEAEERMKTERLIQALTAIAEYTATPEEDSLINWVMTIGDPEGTGKINPQTATRIFSASSLPPDALARVWEIASVDSKDGLLDRQGVGVALRLIGHAQRGETVMEALVNRPGPIASIDSPSSPLGNEAVAGPSSGVPSTLPPLTSHDKAKFRKIFKGAGADNGYLGGQQAREVFMKSKLPWNTLSQIWNLADTQHRGSLDLSDFTVAMYLIQGLMTGQLATVPASLPPQLYEDAARHTRTPSPSPRHRTVSSPNTPALPRYPPPPPPSHPSLIPPPQPQLIPPITASPFSGAPPPRHPSRGPSQPSPRLEVTPSIRVQAEHIFSSLDSRNRGRVKTDAVHTYMCQSGLPVNAGSRILELCDIGRKGHLTKDEFSVALMLMKIRKEGQHLPSTLPPGLLPASTPSHEDDAYDGIARDHSHDNASAGPSRPPPLIITSQSERPSRAGAPPPGTPNIRTSRSTPQLNNGSANSVPSSPFATAPSTPFPGLSVHGYAPAVAATPSDLNITPEERARYDRFFAQLDTQRKGYLLSDIAVPFFGRANLPNDVMATIWDLADSEHDGRITKDDFAVAMHLIRQKLAGKELPTVVPASLFPAHASARAETVSLPSTSRQDSRPPSQEAPPPPPRPASGAQVEPAMTPLPDDLDDDLPRSDTPPPPYSLIASG